MPTLQRPPFEVAHYSYRVTWSAEDSEFVASVAEFPSLSWLAPSQTKALNGLQALVTDVIADLQTQGEPIPEPLSERSYSGKLNLRLGETLHRQIATQAAEENLSINQLIVRRLMAEH